MTKDRAQIKRDVDAMLGGRPSSTKEALVDSSSRTVHRGDYPFDLIPGDVVERRDIRGRKKYRVSHLGHSGNFVQVYTREVGGGGGIVSFDRSQLRLSR